jgi:hypothetical protein
MEILHLHQCKQIVKQVALDGLRKAAADSDKQLSDALANKKVCLSVQSVAVARHLCRETIGLQVVSICTLYIIPLLAPTQCELCQSKESVSGP